MQYEYKCSNSNCPRYNQPLTITKPLSNYNTDEFCTFCNEKLKKLISKVDYMNCSGFHGKKGQY